MMQGRDVTNEEASHSQFNPTPLNEPVIFKANLLKANVPSVVFSTITPKANNESEKKFVQNSASMKRLFAIPPELSARLTLMQNVIDKSQIGYNLDTP